MGFVLWCAPLRFDEQVVWELGQVVVLEVQDLELRSLHPLSQPTHFVPAGQEFSEAPAGQKPETHQHHSEISLSFCIYCPGEDLECIKCYRVTLSSKEKSCFQQRLVS